MRLFVFGLGYTARAFIRSSLPWSRIAGTVRQSDKADRLAKEGIVAFPLDAADSGQLAEEIRRADALLVSAPPAIDGDPLLARFRDAVAGAPRLAWIGYLSTTGVYGDRGGAWTDETAPAQPQSPSSQSRRAAEQGWLALGEMTGKPSHIFRLSGIYGPGRNALSNLARGAAQRIVKPGQVFNRIHVDDIASILVASLGCPRAGAIYNVGDDEPAPPQDVVTYAAALAGIAPPPEIPFDEADLSPMARSFYAENKRIVNRLVKDELRIRLRYPTYREGLEALYEAGEFAQAA
ncbi:SDR family oxidoreductase [Microvirga puerhi]|uniref:SDR family oxidoreductase n=1 Tax=Microvirga puerhi TaxID=2876078 RepID=A0ABS7VME9_9HYPH|nr:SDR family oxidoreductase [Microvirga puerhi]MBZ6076701.1 SDR family oxidoreductase [Microvirga puerhi]